MDVNANWLSTLEVGNKEEMSSSYFIFSPKNTKTRKETAMMTYISGLWEWK